MCSKKIHTNNHWNLYVRNNHLMWPKSFAGTKTQTQWHQTQRTCHTPIGQMDPPSMTTLGHTHVSRNHGYYRWMDHIDSGSSINQAHHIHTSNLHGKIQTTGFIRLQLNFLPHRSVNLISCRLLGLGRSYCWFPEDVWVSFAVLWALSPTVVRAAIGWACESTWSPREGPREGHCLMKCSSDPQWKHTPCLHDPVSPLLDVGAQCLPCCGVPCFSRFSNLSMWDIHLRTHAGGSPFSTCWFLT